MRSWIVAQLGARMHYAVPRILEEAGCLRMLMTDALALPSSARLLRKLPSRLRPKGLERLNERRTRGVPETRVKAFHLFGWQYALRRQAARTEIRHAHIHAWAGRRFCELVLKNLPEQVDGFYTFNGAGLELLRHARATGCYGVMEQTIAPRRVEQLLLADEMRAFPNWHVGQSGGGVDPLIEREEREWSEAHTIICASPFVRDALADCGVDRSRCRVVPYGVEYNGALVPRRRVDGPLRVLTVGQIGLRKGSPYVLEAARRLRRDVHVRMVGPTRLPERILRQIGREIEIVGVVPRSQVALHYDWADVFLLPSICEGSATATYEALIRGLPVVCTPNTGSLVTHGVDGYLVPIRDVEAIVDTLRHFIENRDLARELSERASRSAMNLSVSGYGRRLLEALRESESRPW